MRKTRDERVPARRGGRRGEFDVHSMTLADHDLMDAIERQRHLMIAVATGGPRIEEVNGEYIERRQLIRRALEDRGLPDPNPHDDLWRWYAKWSSGDLPTYASRRLYIADLYGPLVEGLSRGPAAAAGSELFSEPTGWALVDRQIDAVRRRLETARNEEEFQGVGLLCREALISLAQAVYDGERHTPPDGVKPSETDAKRMLEAYLASEHGGSSNELLRKAARASVDLAVGLQHRRTARFRDAAVCAEATIAVVNLITILAGRRDP